MHLELIGYANTCSAARFLERLLRYPACARDHPFIRSLPGSVQDMLFDPTDPVHNLLSTHSTRTDYISSQDQTTELDDLQCGPLAEPILLTNEELKVIVDLALPELPLADATSEAHASLLAALIDTGEDQDQAPDKVAVACVRWVLFPGRPVDSGKLWAVGDRGITHYTLDTDLGHGSVEFDGTIVRLEKLLFVNNTVLAKVLYGKKIGKEPNTQCYLYEFNQPRAITKRFIRADRLKSYTHFAIVRGRLCLNRFYIPTS